MRGAGPWGSGPCVGSSQLDPLLVAEPHPECGPAGSSWCERGHCRRDSPPVMVMRCDSGLASFRVWSHGGTDERSEPQSSHFYTDHDLF